MMWGLGKEEVVSPHQAYKHIWTQCNGENVGWTWQRNREPKPCGMVLRQSQSGLRGDENNFPRTQMAQGRVYCHSIVKELTGSRDVVDEERGCIQKPILFICWYFDFSI